MARAGRPSLLRAINDRAALDALATRGALTRAQIGELTGLSKPTASGLLARLADAGLVVADGVREGGLGRTAELYRINPAAGYAAALDVTAARTRARVLDIAGTVVGEYLRPTPGRGTPGATSTVRAAIAGACGDAGLAVAAVRHVVIGAPGAINPRTGRLGYAAHLPGWHEPHLLQALRDELGIGVDFDNDVNLAAIAERAHGAAAGVDDFVLLWAAEGVGLAVVIGGRLHRGATGGAGEVGYMPMPGAPVVRGVNRVNTGGLQKLVGAPAVHALIREHRLRGDIAQVLRPGRRDPDGSAATVRGVLATRIATGLAAVTGVLE